MISEKKKGVYALFEDDTLVYIGKSIDVSIRVKAHFLDETKKFNTVKFFETKDIDDLEKYMIIKHKPLYNISGVSTTSLRDDFITKVTLGDFIDISEMFNGVYNYFIVPKIVVNKHYKYTPDENDTYPNMVSFFAEIGKIEEFNIFLENEIRNNISATDYDIARYFMEQNNIEVVNKINFPLENKFSIAKDLLEDKEYKKLLMIIGNTIDLTVELANFKFDEVESFNQDTGEILNVK